jgi:flagellar hook-basal body complex protein FliE
MNLSALPSLAGPALRPPVPVHAPIDTLPPATIPFTELESISPGILPLPTPPASGGFGQLVSDVVSGVVDKQAAAAQSVNGLMSGGNVSLHQTMIAMEEASISFQLMVEVRNKMLEAYQELMRMQV